jgi:hypothetical protein
METNLPGRWLLFVAAIAVSALPAVFAPPPGAMLDAAPLLEDRVSRPLHFHPDGRDFVVENGKEFFNRPLYGPNNGFRIDAGDRPEFSLYLPGRGGNLRLGVITKTGAKWLSDAQKIVARYHGGSMLYEISDPDLGDGAINLAAMPVHAAEGLILRIESSGGADPVQLFWSFGGASGERGSRDGDIGTERLPVSQYFQLRPESCAGNTFAIDENKFTLTSKPAAMVGLAPEGAKLGIGDANLWKSARELLDSRQKPASLPVVVGQYSLPANRPAFLAIQRISRPGDDRGELGTYLAVRQETAGSTTAPAAEEHAIVLDDALKLPKVFDEAELYRKSIADKIVADTPDPFINAAATALCVAANGVWDERQGTVMHGAVAWRSKLLGWRGDYSPDELGWHDRAARDMTYWAGRQNVAPIPAQIPGLDPKVNLSRDEPALHSNGDLSNSHYDMNLVFIDAVFRHILWTGDLDYARSVWPVIEKHLAWERRLFRRTYGPEKLPLYEAYCCIWASDDLEYSGGGAAHSSAYNYYHNRMAARLARLLGKDPLPYDAEADLIGKGMRQQLWLSDRGWYAEYKDYLGLQPVHASPALWTFYHTVDSEVSTPMEAWQMSRFVDTQIAHIPIRGEGVLDDGCFTLPTTNWMFYTWSINNVVMAESAHTALAYFQANRSDQGFKLLKGCILDSMYQGLCPGNAGMCTYFDVARGESQRDFADGIGTTSRALVEGLFGVRPDTIDGETLIRPGFPSVWDHASLQHPDFNFAFQRDELRETFTFEPKFSRAVGLRLQIEALRDGLQTVTLNGQPAQWRVLEDSVGSPRIEIQCPANKRFAVEIVWKGQKPAVVDVPPLVASGSEFHAQFGAARVLKIEDPQTAISQLKNDGNTVRGNSSGAIGHRTIFAQVEQGGLKWWLPVEFEIREPFEIVASQDQDAGHLRFHIRNNTPDPIDRDVKVSTGDKAVDAHLRVAAFSESEEIVVEGVDLLPGTNPLMVDLNGTSYVSGSVVNWSMPPSAGVARTLETVDISKVFNDEVAHIFEPDKYLSPRSPFCSLSMPSQGIGSWCRPTASATIDDSGLRSASDQHHGVVLLGGIVFFTPGAGNAKNIAFASQWDNYPREIQVPLSGRASHVYLLMAGSTNWMQSRIENGQVVVSYADNSTQVLRLENPTNWWPIEEDYLIDDYAFRRPEPLPIRVDLRTGKARVLEMATFKGHGGKINGGAATVLDLHLRSDVPLKSLKVKATANEVVIGLMGVTLVRPAAN